MSRAHLQSEREPRFFSSSRQKEKKHTTHYQNVLQRTGPASRPFALYDRRRFSPLPWRLCESHERGLLHYVWSGIDVCTMTARDEIFIDFFSFVVLRSPPELVPQVRNQLCYPTVFPECEFISGLSPRYSRPLVNHICTTDIHTCIYIYICNDAGVSPISTFLQKINMFR